MDPWVDGETDRGEQLRAELLAAYGPDWPFRFAENLRFDPDAEPVEFAPPDEGVVVVRKIFLRLPMEVDEKFKNLGRREDRTPSEIVSTWIAERLADE